jgi:hypothetical protein
MPAPTFQNLGFEAAGPTPGSALGWLLASQATAEEIAGYAPAPERPQEDFERGWLGNEDFLFGFAPTSVEPALFDPAPESIEDFEEGWSQNESYLFELASIAAADYDPGAGTKLVENFDGLWAANESFLFAFAPSDLSAAPTEAFESGWRSNQSFVFAFAPAQLGAASYDAAGTPEPFEDFEELWPNLVMTTV